MNRKIKQFFMALIFAAILIFGWSYPYLGFFIPLCMILGIGIGLFRGRKWCDWYCPRGSFYDSLISPVSPKKQIPPFLKGMPFRLIVLGLLMAIMAANLILRWPDLFKIGRFFVVMMSSTTILGIILAVLIHQRGWCVICPIGTMINLLSRNKKNALKIDSRACIDCKLCARDCPMQIRPYLYKGPGVERITDADCLKCGICVKICPKQALKL